jgi:dTDP-glucose pyrophosphorylase
MHPQTDLHSISENQSLLAAMEKMGQAGHLRTLFLLNEEGKVTGTLTDGDIRRAMLGGVQLTEPAGICGFKNFRFISAGSDATAKLSEWKALGRLLRILDLNSVRAFMPVTAVIMAGGFGKRLQPLTDSVPKPMLPIKGLPILEINIRRLLSFGVEHIYIAVNYLKEQIMAHFGDGSAFGCRIEYIHENEPRGTIGALSELQEKNIRKDILLFNADLLSNIDLDEMFRFYTAAQSDFCMASIPYKVNIPFAVLELADHKITGISEKPTYTYYSNAGFYLFKTALLQKLPKNGFYNATDFVEKLIHEGHNMVQFPILGYWSDIGSLEEYHKAQDDIQYLDLY